MKLRSRDIRISQASGKVISGFRNDSLDSFLSVSISAKGRVEPLIHLMMSLMGLVPTVFISSRDHSAPLIGLVASLSFAKFERFPKI